MRIPVRSSGPTGIEISALGLGSWNTWNRADFDTVLDTLRLAVDAGVTLYDVGIYGADLDQPADDATDVVLARAFSRLGVRRDSILLAAKGWLPSPERPVPPLERQLDVLLRRQQTDHADFLVLGDLMEALDDYTPLLDQVAALLSAGKARAWCVNNWAAAEIGELTAQARTMGLQPPDFAQLKFGLTRRSVAEGGPFRALCEETGLRIQASDTFEGGLVFGPRRNGTPRWIGGDIGGTQARVRASVERIAEAAASLGATTAQLAIALPLVNPNACNVLVGSRTPEQTRDNLGAFDLLERHSPEEIREVAAEFWFDRDAVSPDASWGASRGDDPATYLVLQR